MVSDFNWKTFLIDPQVNLTFTCSKSQRSIYMIIAMKIIINVLIYSFKNDILNLVNDIKSRTFGVITKNFEQDILLII